MSSAPQTAALAGLAALVTLVSCGPRLDRRTTLTLAIDSGPASLDPRLGSDEASRRVNELLYNGLFRIDATARAVPDLAASFERPDDLTVTVHLRPDVLFHDGHRLTAEDVVYTYRSILSDEVPSFRRADLDVLTSVSAVNSGTVIFRLARPFAPILSNLNIPILAAGAGPGAARLPNGTGPFRLQRYRKDEDLLLTRFAQSFEGPAGVETLRLRIIPSETARLLEILKGSVDMIVNDLSPDQLRRLQTDPRVEVQGVPGRNCVYMAFNLDDPILGDLRVRQAFALALDRASIVAHLLHGRATLASGLLPPGHWAFEEDVRRYSLDAAEARRLLDQAGHPDPDGDGPETRFRVTYKTTTSELAQQQAAIIQQQLGRVGVGVDIRAFEWGTFYDDLKAGRFQVVVSNWTEIGDPDIYRLRFHTAYRPPHGFNRGGYLNPAIDRLIDEGATETGEMTRRRLYGEVQRILADDLPYIYLWHREVVVARSARVRGFRLLPGGDFHPLREVTLENGSGSTAAVGDDAG